jgi:NAD(P)-dependent dehydrogenase (short-subunit alcohol dehydrogenase family)
MSLTGKTALITGGVKNLGAQTARDLASVGANLALHYHSSSSKNDASALEAELKQKHPSVKVNFYQGNLTSAGAVTKLFQDVLKDFGQIDIVVNTVGKVLKKPIAEITEEEYDTMFAYVWPSPPLPRTHPQKGAI